MSERRIPSNIEAEEGVLACCLDNPRNLVKIADMLSPEHFYRDTHAEIYRALLTLHQHEKPCTLPNVEDELMRRGTLEQVGGALQLTLYASSLHTLHEVVYFADSVKRTSVMRRLYAASAEIAAAALAQDEDALERAEQLITDIALDGTAKPVAAFSEVIDRYMSDLASRRESFSLGTPGGTPTGLVELDKLLGGLRQSCLYTLAARPGLGKTALALTIALNIVQHAKHALFFSLEMDESEIVQRALSAETCIDQFFLRDGDLDDEQMKHIYAEAARLRPCDLKIDDRTYLLTDIRTKARAVHTRKPLDLIVVDYLQLIETSSTGRGKNISRPEEIAQISKNLKKLARELHVPVVALAQMNRESERRGNALPQLSDLGEGSGIEKDSDCVMFIYCNDEEQQKRDRNEPYDLSIIVKKHRNGRMGSIPLRFRPKLTKFQDQEDINLDRYLDGEPYESTV